jgi:hypothetical protein
MKYSERTFHHNYEERTHSEVERQHQVVTEIVANNLKTLKIKLTVKAKVQYKPKNRERVNLGDNWYCYITDNRNVSRHTILTLHGAPGDHA